MSDAKLIRVLNQVMWTLYGQNFQKNPDMESLEAVFKSSFDMAPDEGEAVLLEENLQDRALGMAKGVYAAQAELDGLIRRHLLGWKLERLGLLELFLLRTGLFAISSGEYKLKNLIYAIKRLAAAYGLDRAENLISGVLLAYARECEEQAGKAVEKKP